MIARSIEERIAPIDAEIPKKQEEIRTLKAQKQKPLHPVITRTAMEKAKVAGLSVEEIAEKLGLEMQSHILWRWTARMHRPFLYT